MSKKVNENLFLNHKKIGELKFNTVILSFSFALALALR